MPWRSTAPMSEGKLAWQTTPHPALTLPYLLLPAVLLAHASRTQPRARLPVAFSVPSLQLTRGLPQAIEGGGKAGLVPGWGELGVLLLEPLLTPSPQLPGPALS